MGSTLVLDRRLGSLRVPRNAASIAWVGLLAFVASLVPGALVPTEVVPRPVPAIAPNPVSIYGLPLPAQALISQTLGNGDMAYHLRGREARNPEQRYSAEFAASGVTVRAGGERLGLSLEGLPAAVPVVTANRVEYRHGSVTEWYANGPLGLEQGFTLERPLRSSLRVRLSGTLTPALAGRTVVLSADGEPVLRLRGLHAYDADGRSLPSRFELAGRTLLVRVDTGNARYPVTVDPFLERAKLTAADGAANDEFGVSVAVAGDTAVVGAAGDDSATHGNAGSAYVFVRSGSVWGQQAKLTAASDRGPNDQFGVSVAVAGDTAVIGAYGDDTAAGADAGSAYVFVRSGSVWSRQAKLTASDGAAGDLFGFSVAMAGETAVVGAQGDDTAAGTNAGSAYVFVRSGSVWGEQAKLTASDGGVEDRFGVSVAVAGDTAVVGAFFDDTAAGMDAGSAYVFVRSGSVWGEQAKLTAFDGGVEDRFGVSVAVAGDTVVVGAYWDNTTGVGSDAGSAYVFVRSGSVWGLQAKLTASDAVASDRFGVSVAVAGDTVVVGAYWDSTFVATRVGAAYVFVRSGSVWSEQTKLTASDGAELDFFGVSVAVTGNTVVVGAYLGDKVAGDNAGLAYVFEDVACHHATRTLFIDVPSGVAVSVLRSGDDIVVAGVGACAGSPTVLNTDLISVTGADGSESLTIDLSGGPFAPGATAEGSGLSEIEWVASSVESLVIQGSSGNDMIRFGSAGGNLNSDDDADLTLPDVATSIVYGALGSDVLSGAGAFGADPGKWARPLHLYGQDGGDKLTGGTDDDLLDGGAGVDDIRQFNVSDGGDTIVGGAGVDKLSYSSRQATDPLSVTLDGVANDGSAGEGDNVGTDVENVLLGAGNDFFDATALTIKNLVQGGAGADELHGGGSGDQLRGDGGNDLLFGDGGNDVLNAIEPETGTNDTLSGGAGSDTCRIDDADVINDC